jgi:hypothetical protein
MGYDESINRCPEGSINNDCRVSPKPVHWEYLNEAPRQDLHQHVTDLLKIRNEYDVFTSGEATLSGGNSLNKQMTIRNTPYTASPTDASEMNVQVAVNFDVVTKDIALAFPHTGTWYDYYNNGQSIQVSLSTLNFTLAPGQYKMYTDVQIETPVVTALEDEQSAGLKLYPNPVGKHLYIDQLNAGVSNIILRNMQGQMINIPRVSLNTWDVSGLRQGLYIVEISSGKSVGRVKFIKK